MKQKNRHCLTVTCFIDDHCNVYFYSFTSLTLSKHKNKKKTKKQKNKKHNFFSKKKKKTHFAKSRYIWYHIFFFLSFLFFLVLSLKFKVIIHIWINVIDNARQVKSKKVLTHRIGSKTSQRELRPSPKRKSFEFFKFEKIFFWKYKAWVVRRSKRKRSLRFPQHKSDQ